MALQPGLFNITTATNTTLIEKRSLGGSVSSINITNAADVNFVYVSLYLDDGTNQTYFFKKTLLSVGERIFLNEGVSFNDTVFDLKLTTEQPSTSYDINVNVIIK